MHWLQEPFINLEYVASLLYGSRSRLHTRKLQDRIAHRFAFQAWEKEKLEQIRKQLMHRLSAAGSDMSGGSIW
jgi:hypothetical protein